MADETQPGGDEGAAGRRPSGPRHAAPRKSLLTKLHVPAGKAVALAAMPTAVLMGMGLTPHLAQADEQPSSPFTAGPCVTQSDTPAATHGTADSTPADKGAKGAQDTKATPDTKGAQGAEDGSGAKGAAGTPATARPTATATGGSSAATAGKTGDSSQATQGKTPEPTVSPSAPATAAPSSGSASGGDNSSSDPLGLGNLLGGLLGIPKGGSKPTPTPAPTTQAPAPPATTAPPAPDPTTTQAPAKPSSGAAKGSTGSVGDTVKGVVGGAAHAAGKAVKGRTDAAGTPSPSASPGATANRGGSDAASGGGQAYPCPVYDAKALADAKVEGGIPLLADQPWTLKSSLLTLYGLNYEGIVQVRTYSGTLKDVMKFTATGIDIGDLQQTVQGPGGSTTTVTGRAGSTSTIRNGTVTLYTESLSGNLFGLKPITFTPKAPPPLILPVLFFTDATVVQAAQFGGDLHIPDMRVLPGRHGS
nr:hydrogenase expression protein HypF [Streptomyces sp. SID4948]